MSDDAYAKFMVRAISENGTTTVGAADAREALAALKDLHDRGMAAITVSDRKGQSWSELDLHREAESDALKPASTRRRA